MSPKLTITLPDVADKPMSFSAIVGFGWRTRGEHRSPRDVCPAYFNRVVLVGAPSVVLPSILL